MKFFGLDWDGIQEILVNAAGAGNVALLGQAYEKVSADWVPGGTQAVFAAVNTLLAESDSGPLDPATLSTAAKEALVNLIVAEIAKRAPVVILQKLSPAGAVLSTVYNGLTTTLLQNTDVAPGIRPRDWLLTPSEMAALPAKCVRYRIGSR